MSPLSVLVGGDSVAGSPCRRKPVQTGAGLSTGRAQEMQKSRGGCRVVLRDDEDPVFRADAKRLDWVPHPCRVLCDQGGDFDFLT